MTNDSPSNLLQQVLLKYRQRQIFAIPISPATVDEDGATSDRLSATDRLLINKFGNAHSRGILAARRKDLGVAAHLFTIARSLLDTNLLSEEGQLWYQSLMDQRESFLDCRHGDFEQARQRLFHSLSIDLELENRYRHDDLILHRIQQVHNLARVEAYDSQPQRAIRLILEIMSYLDGKIDTLSIPGDWGYQRIARQPIADVAGMFLQVAGEIAFIMAGMNCEEAGALFTSTAEEFLTSTNQQSCHPLAYQWLLIKLDYSRGDLDRFLNNVADFIAQQHSDIGLLYYSTLIDLLIVCDQLDTPVANKFKAEIISDVIRNPQKVDRKFLPFFQATKTCQLA